jgi:hypothetical protein
MSKCACEWPKESVCVREREREYIIDESKDPMVYLDTKFWQL